MRQRFWSWGVVAKNECTCLGYSYRFCCSERYSKEVFFILNIGKPILILQTKKKPSRRTTLHCIRIKAVLCSNIVMGFWVLCILEIYSIVPFSLFHFHGCLHCYFWFTPPLGGNPAHVNLFPMIAFLLVFVSTTKCKPFVLLYIWGAWTFDLHLHRLQAWL